MDRDLYEVLGLNNLRVPRPTDDIIRREMAKQRVPPAQTGEDRGTGWDWRRPEEPTSELPPLPLEMIAMLERITAVRVVLPWDKEVYGAALELQQRGFLDCAQLRSDLSATDSALRCQPTSEGRKVLTWGYRLPPARPT